MYHYKLLNSLGQNQSNSLLQYTQDYVNGIEFRKNGTAAARIEAIYHNHGRVYNKNVDLNTTKAWQYEYYIKDHLGNVRLAFTDKNNNGVVDVTTTSTNEIIQVGAQRRSRERRVSGKTTSTPSA